MQNALKESCQKPNGHVHDIPLPGMRSNRTAVLRMSSIESPGGYSVNMGYLYISGTITNRPALNLLTT